MSSDGIMVDSTSPVSGTVYDGLGKYMCIIYIIRATNNCDVSNKVCILLRDYPTQCVFYRDTTQHSVYSMERLPNKVCIL